MDSKIRMQGSGGRIVKNIRVMLLGQLATWAISFVWIIYLPRYLGATDMGRYAIATAIWVIMSSIINTGTSVHLTKEIARAPEKAPELLGTALIQRYIIFLLCCAPVAIYVYLAQHSRETTLLIFILALTMPATHTIIVLNSIFQGREIMQYISIIDVVIKGLFLAVALVFMYLGWGIIEIASASIFTTAIAVTLQFWILRRYMPIRFTWDGALAADMLRRSMPYCVSSLVLVVYGEIDKLIIPMLVDERTVGWFSVAASLSATLLFIPSILTTAVFPALARGASEGGDGAVRILRKSLDIALITGVPIGLGLAIVADPRVGLIYQSKFPNSGPVLSVMSITLIFSYVATVLGRFLVASDLTNAWTLAMVAGIALAFPLNFVLIPWTEQLIGNGAVGAAFRLLFSEILMAGFALWMLPKGTVNSESAGTALRILVAGAVMAAACWFVRDKFIAVTVLVGMVTYTLMILVLRVLKPDDIELIMSTIRSTLAGFRFGPRAR